MNGDSVPELLIGAPAERVADQPNAGAAYVHSGATAASLQRLQSTQPEWLGQFGISIASVPDSNGDGRPEIVVGAHNETQIVGAQQGRAYLFLSCPADLNADGLATSQDFFDSLTAWFTQEGGRADFNRDGILNSQDFFDFLAAFFNGCP
jgi:hypothetical protein